MGLRARAGFAAAQAIVLVLAAAALLALASPPGPATAAGGTVWVDDDWSALAPGDNPPGPATSFGTDSFATLTSALATTPTTVTLAAGNYTEQVVISSDVTIIGASRSTTKIHNPGGLTAVHTIGAILAVTGGAQVTMSGVTVSGPGVSIPGPFAAGILVADGAHLDLRNSAVTAIRDEPLGGVQTGHAIIVGTRSDQGGASTGFLHLAQSRVSDYQKTGVIVRSGSTAEIIDNDIVGQGWTCVNASNGIQIQGTATVTNNRITDNRYYSEPSTPGCGSGAATTFALGVFSPDGPVTVSGNTFEGNEIGIYLSAPTSAATAVTVSGNDVTGLEHDASGHPEASDTYGVISLWQGPNAVIDGNTVEHSAVGLYLAGGGETVTSNSVHTNATGIHVDVAPVRLAGNSITDNTVGATGTTTGGPNWWGCNSGPGGAGCDTASGYTESEWLVLTVTLPVGCEVAVDDELPATVAITSTNLGTVMTDAWIPSTHITPITATGLTPSPAEGFTTNGELPVTLRGTAIGLGALSAKARNATVTAPGAGTGCDSTIVVTAAAETAVLAETGDNGIAMAWLAAVLIGLGALLVSRRRAPTGVPSRKLGAIE
jgi:LPXTG-motif cell wall-anchored protein